MKVILLKELKGKGGEGDVVEAYMTYNMAYGDKYVSTIPRESPVAWFFTVESVEYDE